jgi:putative phosphoribosyl transferase
MNWPINRFRDRTDAGQFLASKLAKYAGRPDVIVLALPRGGVAVGFEVAQALQAPLGVFLVRKIGTPGHEELAMGAVATGNVRVLQPDVVDAFGISPFMVESATANALQELARREKVYRGSHPPPQVTAKTVILVDDGLATGATMHAAIAALKLHRPARIIAAVPVALPEICEEFRAEVDEIICAETPASLNAVGLWYENFSQLTDDDVRNLLERAAQQYKAGQPVSRSKSCVKGA